MTTPSPSFSSSSPIGCAVIGLGFMGCTHVRGYQAAQRAGLPCTLIAVADRRAERLTGQSASTGNLGNSCEGQLFDPQAVRTYLDPRQVFLDPAVHAVSICTYTDTHVDLAVAALRAGKHVLVEKPVALASADVARLAAAAKESPTLCMPGMVMRYWPEWVWLRSAIKAETYGKVRSASFQRVGTPPQWTDFYRDISRSGGALFDLHIHDSDFIRWCFGEPSGVESAGTIDHITTLYAFDESGPAPRPPLHVTAEGGNDATPGFGFRMRYTVNFERATAEFDITRSTPLVVHSGGQSTPVGPETLGTVGPYDLEIRAFLEAIRTGAPAASLPATIDDAVKTAQLLEAEMASLSSGSTLCRPRQSA